MASTTTTQTEPITAENVLRLFPDVNTDLANKHNASNASQDSDLQGYDEEQIRLMDEVCIVLDENDNPIGSASKKTCHLMTNINKGLLHRAFSAFVFHPRTHKLLLQQRAASKITFPSLWTNTCCSHPLGIPSETGATLMQSVAGVRRAAQRKLGHELGMPARQLPTDQMRFLTRIQYMAPSDGKWGEHEIDYIVFVRPRLEAGEEDVEVEVNENEVSEVRWVDAGELRAMMADKENKFTPWFKLICEGLLFEWWERMGDADFEEKYVGETEIRRM
ncbi:MAG: isopentenyl-diphosphate delta-isomerase idi1 [Bathelium mastoideum]|nr:MAG: isopentenyl-diphosphate delta-isomerase idi1 [Bathelium mastoideum]